MKYLSMFAALAAAFAVSAAENAVTHDTAQPASAVSEQPGQKKPAIAVCDFTTIDIQGQKLYAFTDRASAAKPMDTLTNDDRETIDDRMLGLVRMIDASDTAAANTDERTRLNRENDLNRARQTELADKILKTSSRTVVIGAEYMLSALAESKNITTVDRRSADKAFAAMEKIQTGVKLDKIYDDFAKTSGATHMLYCTVADLGRKQMKFSGYGVNTESTEYTLDVLVKLIELSSGKVVFSGVFTGVDSVMNTEYLKTVDEKRFQTLLKSAISKTASAIDSRFAPAALENDPLASTPMPKIKIAPRVAPGSVVEVYIDGAFRGNAPLEISITPGKYKIELKSPDHETKIYDTEIAGGENFTPEMTLKNIPVQTRQEKSK